MPTLNFPSPDVANPGDKVHTGDVTWVFTDKGFWSSEVGEAGGGASVHYGPTAPDSPSQGDLWYADDSTVEFGGRLYIYTGTEWVDTSLPGGGSGDSGGAEVGSLQTVTDNGAVTTNVCEFQGGVNVTGGTYDATAPCIYSTNGSNLNISSLSSQLRLRRENISLASLGVTSSGSATLLNFILKESTGLVSSGGGISTVNINSDQGNYSGFSRVRGYTFQFPRNDGSATDPTTEIIGYSAYPAVTQNENDTSITYYGFRSSLNRGQNYNFYAEGTAPNYFGGTIRTGNVSNPGGTGSDGNPEQDEVILNWTTQSNASNAIRIANNYAHISRYNTSPSVAPYAINRLGSSTGLLIAFAENGKPIDSIRLDGAGGITYGTSDYRAKENIVDLPSATDTIKALRPVNFNFTWAPGKTRPGFIAHEVSDVLPAAVTGDKDATEPIGTVTDYDGTELETNISEAQLVN